MSSSSIHYRPEKTDKKLINPKNLPVKMYEPRNSPLTDLFIENKHIKSVYNLGIAMFLGTVLSTAVTEYANEGRVYLGFRTINCAFRNFRYVFLIWPVMFLSSLAVFYGFVIWAKTRIHLKFKHLTYQFFNLNLEKVWDFLCLTFFVLYYPTVLYFAFKAVLVCHLGIASSLTVTMEATRFLMKAHAFVRTNCPKYIQKTNETLHPTLNHYFYFLFAPVLVYKESYPR
ncbi:hypothetical protein RN001_013179 [Aquatica leii]|uniref:Uncharacterized protein n=1 Tax=Aquatica leii TaxID=1421715 RepID=A0AAN7NZQ6_9COLE|nr:hypothetical protein RN001_013179 [Aquatica leii]